VISSQMYHEIYSRGQSLVPETVFGVQQTEIQNLRISGQTWQAEQSRKDLFLSSVKRWRMIFTRSSALHPTITTASRPFSTSVLKVSLQCSHIIVFWVCRLLCMSIIPPRDLQ